jgi:hypothetical protein
MSHRRALASSLALTLALALTIFVARARLFQPATPSANGQVPPAADVIDTSAGVEQLFRADTTTTEQSGGWLPTDEESEAPLTSSETRDRNTVDNERVGGHENDHETDHKEDHDED